MKLLLNGAALKKACVNLGMEQHALKKCKQLFEYQHLLLLRDIWWSKLSSVFKYC